MNILHTSDLHIGKRLMDRERLPEQREVLDEIVDICERENVSLVLIAGDVFDTFMPSAEAEDLFFHFIKKLSGEERIVVIVSGNHDDGVRLSASAPLATEHGVYIFGNKPRVFAPCNRATRIVSSGEYYLEIEDKTGERVYINALPYPNEARFKENKSEESFTEKMTRWIERGEEGYKGDCFHILLAHLFVVGGKTSESERDIDLGGARAVPLSCLPQEGYVALGHLHKKQTLGNARYSGSILQYSFDECNAEKSVTLIKTQGMNYQTQEIPLVSGKKLIRLQANSVENAINLLSQYENSFIELTLILSEPLTALETERLREANENLISLIVRVTEINSPVFVARSSLGAEELFTQYYRSVYGEDPKGELTTAFLQLLEENA